MQSVAKVEISEEADAQFIILPTVGCTGCIELGHSLMNSSSLANTTFIYYSVNDSSETNNKIAVQNETKLNQIYLGVGYQPIVVQLKNGRIKEIFGLTPTEKEGVEKVIAFDQNLTGSSDPS